VCAFPYFVLKTAIKPNRESTSPFLNTRRNIIIINIFLFLSVRETDEEMVGMYGRHMGEETHMKYFEGEKRNRDITWKF
jgi:hypothetical protein